MSNLNIIEEEIAKLEEEQRSNQNKLALLRKSKTAMLEQAEEDRKSSKLNKLEKIISAANDLVKDTSLRFEHDQILEAVLVKLGESHVDNYILTRDLDLMKIENFLDLHKIVMSRRSKRSSARLTSLATLSESTTTIKSSNL